MYTGSSYNFATENDTRVISAAVAMFQGTPDPPPPGTSIEIASICVSIPN